MADATAHVSDYRQSPRKVGRVADMVRGKRVVDALAVLDVMPKRAAGPLAKLIRSAVSNARGKGLAPEALVISKLQVGKGVTFKRSSPRARGSAAIIRKKASHVSIELSAMAPAKHRMKKAAAKAAEPETAATE